MRQRLHCRLCGSWPETGSRRPVDVPEDFSGMLAFHGVGFDEREAARGYHVSTREPWNKKQPIMISKDAAPIISFPMKNPTIGTVDTA